MESIQEEESYKEFALNTLQALDNPIVLVDDALNEDEMKNVENKVILNSKVVQEEEEEMISIPLGWKKSKKGMKKEKKSKDGWFKSLFYKWFPFLKSTEIH